MLLSSNPNAINLLKERIKYEQTLRIEDYINLDFPDKIDWFFLSKNPNVTMDFIKKHYDGSKVCIRPR